METLNRRQSRRATDSAPAKPVPGRWTAPAWHASRLLSTGRANVFLRMRSAAAMPTAVRARFRAMGLPDDVTVATLQTVHALTDWPEAWTQTAQRFLGEARRGDRAGQRTEAAMARRQAALCYHVASLIGVRDQRTARALRASATGLFAQSLAILTPTAHRVEVRWRATQLPGYLVIPNPDTMAAPLAVFLNGATTSKEETLLWSSRLLDHGIAVLALDWPGTGEVSALPIAVDCDDITDGLLELAQTEQAVDPARIALIGFSLGGAIAVRAAANNRRIAACVAVTPPFDPTTWLHRANPIVWEQLAALAGDAALVREFAETVALPADVARLRCPLLVFGAGHDLVIPPGESLRLAAAAADLATLVWFPKLGHGLYEVVGQWTDDAATWLSALFDLPAIQPAASTQVDAASSTAAETPPPPQPPTFDDRAPDDAHP